MVEMHVPFKREGREIEIQSGYESHFLSWLQTESYRAGYFAPHSRFGMVVRNDVVDDVPIHLSGKESEIVACSCSLWEENSSS